jgi:hypothetical protein
MSEAEKAAAYASSTGHDLPPYLPSRVRVPRLVRGFGPFSAIAVDPGDYPCESNRFGAVSVAANGGFKLGLKPSEFEVLEWVRNADAGE